MEKKRRDSRKFLRILAFFCLWLGIVFIGGGLFADKVRQAEDGPPEISEAVDLVGEGIPYDQKTYEQKEASDARKKKNLEAFAHDLGALTNGLGIANWNVVGAETKDGIPSLVPHFPAGQNFSAWREAFVVRSYVNVKISNPTPFVYQIYNDWITMQLPDLKLKTKEDKSGISFSGYSQTGKVFVSGKIMTTTLDTTVFILQYVIKNDGQPDVESKASRWQAMLESTK